MSGSTKVAQENAVLTLDKGVFTISLDFELIWGTLDKPNWKSYLPLCKTEREEVVGRLLALFDRYSIRATWCTVGHLFLPSCDGHHGELSGYSGDVRQSRDAASNERTDPNFYGRQLIEQIQQCRTPQEIGSHSYTHVVFNTIDRKRAESEVANCVRAAGDLGIRLRSFVYPRNRVAHLDLLARYGFAAYRPPDPVWHEITKKRRWYHRAGNLTDVLFMSTPPVVDATIEADGICAIPGSMLWTPSHGSRRYLPIALREVRARKGLERAAREKKIFHLWFHPTDMVTRQNAMLEGFERTLERAASLRKQGRIEFLSMDQIADRIRASARVPEISLETTAR